MSVPKITVFKDDLKKYRGEILAVPVFEKDISFVKKLDKELGNELKKIFDRDEFTGTLFTTRFLSTYGRLNVETLLLVGLGKKEKFDLEVLRMAAGIATNTAQKHGMLHLATALHHITGFPSDQAARAVLEGGLLVAYAFDIFKTKKEEKVKILKELTFIGNINKKVCDEVRTVCNAVFLTRDLVNMPAGNLTPEVLAEHAKKELNKKVKVTVFDKKKIKQLGMGALLAVNSGSAYEPRFVVMEYEGGSGKPVVLVGKGITFDSGGINIKPWKAMIDMKTDMAGAATVLGVVKAASELSLPVNIVGIFPSTENMTGSRAYKPGDVIVTYGKQTIEVAHTDAEGRLILADAFSYVEKKYDPKFLMDFATLTGACVVALGYEAAGLVVSDEKLVSLFKSAEKNTGERVWHLPLYNEYKNAVKSEIADVKNIGFSNGEAGALTAAAFLSSFVNEKTSWAHFDIAGPSFIPKEQHYLPKGATGYGVRLVIDFLKNL